MIDIDVVIDVIKVFITFVYGDPVLEWVDQIWNVLRISQQQEPNLGLW